MADATAYLKIYNISDYPALERIHYDEIRRYAGLGKAALGANADIDLTKENAILEECLKEALPVLTYKVSYRRDSVEWTEGRPNLPFDGYDSKDILVNLKGCDEIVMFAASLGIGIDRLIARYNRVSPVKALFLQAIGAERIEALCNLFNTEIRDEANTSGKTTHPRYSPGYGDLPLDVQKEFVTILDCGRRLGVTLNESLLMSPSKSVTAFIGIEPGTGGIACDRYIADNEIEHDCESCSKLDCEWRR